MNTLIVSTREMHIQIDIRSFFLVHFVQLLITVELNILRGTLNGGIYTPGYALTSRSNSIPTEFHVAAGARFSVARERPQLILTSAVSDPLPQGERGFSFSLD